MRPREAYDSPGAFVRGTLTAWLARLALPASVAASLQPLLAALEQGSIDAKARGGREDSVLFCSCCTACLLRHYDLVSFVSYSALALAYKSYGRRGSLRT